MNRRNMLTVIELVLVTATLVVAVCILGNAVQTQNRADRQPWVPAAFAGAITGSVIAAVAMLILLGYAVRIQWPRLVMKLRTCTTSLGRAVRLQWARLVEKSRTRTSARAPQPLVRRLPRRADQQRHRAT